MTSSISLWYTTHLLRSKGIAESQAEEEERQGAIKKTSRTRRIDRGVGREVFAPAAISRTGESRQCSNGDLGRNQLLVQVVRDADGDLAAAEEQSEWGCLMVE